MTDSSESAPASSGGVLDRPPAEGATLTAPLPGAAVTPLAPGSLEEVVVLDYGGQYCQLIARRIRDCGVFSEMLPHDVPLRGDREAKAAGDHPLGRACVGLCAGSSASGAGPARAGRPGDGHLLRDAAARCTSSAVASSRPRWASLGALICMWATPGVLLRGTPREQTCWMSHRDTVFEPPPGFTALASSSASPVAAVEDSERGIYGIQFHPEVVHTPYGQEILTQVPDRRVRLRANVDGGLDRRGPGAAHSRAGGGGQGHLRTVRWRRFLGGGAARASGGGRAADVRVRRPRPDAQGRGRAGGERVSRHVQGAAGRR